MAQSVIIIGAGIIGAATAYTLTMAGAKVTLIDAGADSATAASFGWVNASYYATQDHHHLRCAGLKAWRQLNVPTQAQGCLCWDQSEAELITQHDTLSALGYPVRMLDRSDFVALEPNIANPPNLALHFPQEIVVDAAMAAQSLIDQATTRGTKCFRGLRVTGVEATDKTATVHTVCGPLTADQIVVTAGTGTTDLLSPFANIPLRPSPTLVVRSGPVNRISHHVLASPVGDVRQCRDGRFMMPTDIKHQATDTSIGDRPLHDVAGDALDRLQSLFPDAGLQWQDLSLAWRPVPQDGLPIVGQVADRVHVAVMHSGVTLGPLMGDLVAEEVLNGVTNRTQNHLAQYRPDRFRIGETAKT